MPKTWNNLLLHSSITICDPQLIETDASRDTIRLYAANLMRVIRCQYWEITSFQQNSSLTILAFKIFHILEGPIIHFRVVNEPFYDVFDGRRFKTF